MPDKQVKIKVTVDKSHLFTLGEKMYKEGIEFLREAVNNAYDADATEVRVMINDDKITIEDNGSGMNEKDLEQFFTVGSEEKTLKNVSPRFGRKRIGQFGVGKFSALALADQFIVRSVKRNYLYAVVFDRAGWRQSESWELPIAKAKINVLEKEGTTIILNKLNKKINVSEAEKYLKQSVPIRAKKFNVYLNNKKMTAKTIAGKITPIKIKTLYGLIEGEIIMALDPRDMDEPGVECRIKEVLIKRELFNLDKKYHQGLNRIGGSVNADFLPLISARTDFIVDSPEYKMFYQLMQAELDKVLQDFKKQSDTKNIAKITKELQQIMRQIKEALKLNPDFIPKGKAISRLKKAGKKKIVVAACLDEKSDQSKTKEEDDISSGPKKTGGGLEQKKKFEVNPLVMKKIRVEKLGINCGIVSLGINGPEALSQGNVIYINQDHPLYQKFYVKLDALSLYLLKIIAQEVILMKKPHLAARDAFDWQSKLLKDALCKF